MVERLSFRRHVSWNTKSNKNRRLRTPGGRLVYHVLKKTGKQPLCGDTKAKLIGMKRLRPVEYKRLPKRARRVSRAYGGTKTAKAVRNRIVRAFLIEEQRCVKQVLIEKEKLKKEDEPAPKKSSKKKKATA